MHRLKRAILASAQGGAAFPEPGVVERDYLFAPGFLGFSGHFPGFPVLPALIQVLTAVTTAEAFAGHPLAVESVENAKFLLQIGPDEPVSVRCRQGNSEGRPAVSARLTVPKGLASSFRLTFAEPTEGG